MKNRSLTYEDAYKACFRQELGDKYEMFLVVKKEIDKWNPYGLLPDAPDNEFDGKSEWIAKQIEHDSTVQDIASVISKVFSDDFEPQYFYVNMCVEVAENIRFALDQSERK